MGKRKFEVGDVVKFMAVDPPMYALITDYTKRGYNVKIRVEKERDYSVHTKRLKSMAPLEKELIKRELFSDVEIDYEDE